MKTNINNYIAGKIEYLQANFDHDCRLNACTICRNLEEVKDIVIKTKTIDKLSTTIIAKVKQILNWLYMNDSWKTKEDCQQLIDTILLLDKSISSM